MVSVTAGLKKEQKLIHRFSQILLLLWREDFNAEQTEPASEDADSIHRSFPSGLCELLSVCSRPDLCRSAFGIMSNDEIQKSPG